MRVIATMENIGRLGFLKGLAAGSVASVVGFRCGAAVGRPVVSSVGDRFTFVSPRVGDPVRFFLVGDTHMTVNDDRDNDYLRYTRRKSAKRIDVSILPRPRLNPPVQVLQHPDYAR